MPDHNITASMNAIATDAPVGIRKVDTRRGALDGSLSSQWFARPDDQRFLTLEDLLAAVKGRRERSRENTHTTSSIEVLPIDEDDHRKLTLATHDGLMTPNHWAFGQVCSRVGAPASFLRELILAPAVLHERLRRSGQESLKFMRTINEDGSPAELTAVTGPDYGRVWDQEVVEAVMKVTANGGWKVPGMMNWGDSTYDPSKPVTKQSTTLYASDRDVFIFQCRDQYPIEVGKLDNGDPDYLFPGFLVSNSEVGSRSLTIEMMYLRGVCMNRNLWGVQNKESLRMRHSKGLPIRFAGEAMPRLEEFSRVAASAVAAKVMAAKTLKVGADDDEVQEFIQGRGFTKKAAADVMALVQTEEGHRARSLWDVVNGLTAKARTINHQDERVALERQAGALMDKVSA